MPPNTTVYALNATWTVPDLPPDSTANASDPWFQTEPTESWWVGLQGGAVLQPVMELNGLMPHAYDAVSWNCCMGNMAWYSFPLIALPGETISGEIVRVSGAEVDAADSLYVYATVTGVSSAARGVQQTVLYSAMRQGDAAGVRAASAGRAQRARGLQQRPPQPSGTRFCKVRSCPCREQA